MRLKSCWFLRWQYYSRMARNKRKTTWWKLGQIWINSKGSVWKTEDCDDRWLLNTYGFRWIRIGAWWVFQKTIGSKKDCYRKRGSSWCRLNTGWFRRLHYSGSRAYLDTFEGSLEQSRENLANFKFDSKCGWIDQDIDPSSAWVKKAY